MNLLIVYGTKNGQTKKIAERLAEAARRRGTSAMTMDARATPSDLSLASFDGVMAGASVNNGRFQPSLGAFVDAHRVELARMPSAFFSVSLSEADPNPRLHDELRRHIGSFLVDARWRPAATASFAGALPPSRFRWLMRLFWRRLDKRTDEFTDWNAVDRFAEEFVTTLRPQRRAA